MSITPVFEPVCSRSLSMPSITNVIDGRGRDLDCGAERAEAGRMLVIAKGANVTLRANDAVRAVMIGGAPLDGERHIYWNFVSSSKERIEDAKRDWKEERFPKVPGDEIERIPLPK